MPSQVQAFKKPIVSVILAVLVISLIVFGRQKKPLATLRLPVDAAVYTLQIGSFSLFDGIGNIWQNYINLVDLQKDNETLRQEIAKLEGENTRLAEKSLLADRLQALLDFKEHQELDTIAATVIGRKPTQWFETFIINKGQADGVEIDMGVIVPQGIVGKVIHAATHFSQVLLVSDRNSAVSAKVQRTREQGIVQGVDSGSARLKYFPHDAAVEVGDLLLTSGLEGSFSKGLKIGRVEQILGRKKEPFLKIEIGFDFDLEAVEEVLVIRSIEDQSLPE